MSSQSSIVKKMNTFLDETIHIMPKCNVHFHGHQNKVVPLMKPFILTMTFIFTIAPNGQLMTFKATISHVGSITTTLARKTWSSQVT